MRARRVKSVFLFFFAPLINVCLFVSTYWWFSAQARWLEEGKAVVKQQAFLMKRALDNTNLRDGLKYGSNMLCELRTGLLSPKNFYELYIMVTS